MAPTRNNKKPKKKYTGSVRGKQRIEGERVDVKVHMSRADAERLEELAAADDLLRSNYIARVLKEHIRQVDDGTWPGWSNRHLRQ